MAAKLTKEVHVKSYTEEQRATLLSFLYHNKDSERIVSFFSIYGNVQITGMLSRMACERLIPKWESEQDGDSALNSLFDPSDEEALRIYISTLFRVSITLDMIFNCFPSVQDDFNKCENAWEFVEIIKEENPEMICSSNWNSYITKYFSLSFFY